MSIRKLVHARAGLIGNPSDGFFGKTISIIVRDFAAEVVCRESEHIVIVPQRCDRLEFENIDELMSDVGINGYYGGIRLIKAAIKCFGDHCRERGVDVAGRGFTIGYGTNIPMRVGLAGSSAIVTAVFRALMEFFGVEISNEILPNLILRAEAEELGIGAGLQDRVIQVYEGAVFMDFDRAHFERAGHGRYECLDPAALPPLFLAYHDRLAEGTEVTHNDLRSRFDRGDGEVVEAMERFADLAQQARDLIVAGRGSEIGPLMGANFDLRDEICSVSQGHRELVMIGRNLGACVKFAGSGGAVIGTYDGKPATLEKLRAEYGQFGANVIVPTI